MRKINKLPGGAQDPTVLELIRRNDARTFSFLYQQYWKPLLNFAAHYLKDHDSCEEVVQQLFVQLHIKMAPLKIKSSVSSYLFAALRNKILNHLRDQAVYKKHMSIAAARMTVTQNDVDQLIDMKQLQREISFSIAQMPDKCREVYKLHDQHHLTVKKIAALLNRPVDTVEKQLRKANKLLRNHLQDNKMNRI